MADKLYFLYGSETGNSEHIAKELHHQAVSLHGYPDAQCMTLNQAITKKILEPSMQPDGAGFNVTVIIVCSTTGEGEPPDNASRFRRWLRNTTKGNFTCLRFTVLALGDTNYNNFCAAGIYIDGKMSELGGTRFFPRGEADDGVSLEIVVEPWKAGLWEAIKGEPAAEAVSHATYVVGAERIDMSVPQEVAIIYMGTSHICSTVALFTYERITELGGSATLYTVQNFRVEKLVKSPELLVFILDSSEPGDNGHTLAIIQQAHVAAPQYGIFSPLLNRKPGSAGMLSDEDAATRTWLCGPAIRAFSSLCIAPRLECIQQVTLLDKGVKDLLASDCKMEFLCKKQATAEVPSIAVSEDDLLQWLTALLDNVPGITMDAAKIAVLVDKLFYTRVSPAFREAAREPLSECCDASVSVTSHSRAASRNRLADEVGEFTTSTTPRDSKPLNDYLLTPVVILYSGNTFVRDVAHDINSKANSQYHLRSSVVDLSNVNHTGFPRLATFVFVISGGLTKPMAAFFKTLRFIKNDGKQMKGVKFTILGVGATAQHEKFNEGALELETLLLSLSAEKIHCTALADLDNSDCLVPVIQAWERNLWSSIMSPTISMAYIDAASPVVSAGKRVMPLLSPTGQSHPTFGNQDELLTEIVHTSDTGAMESSLVGASLATKPSSVLEAPTSPLFPWDSIPLDRESASHTPIVFLYSSSGMSKSMAVHAATSAKEFGFATLLLPFSHYHRIDFSVTPNVVLFCESGPDGQSNGGRRFKKYLLNPAHPPDHLSHVRFAVLGLSPSGGVAHPAFTWANMLSRLQAIRVFPVVIMASMSQLHSLGMPWSECVFATMAMQHSLPNNGFNAVGSPREVSAPQTDRTLSTGKRILFLFGSTTGISEAIARDLHEEATRRGYTSRIAALNCYDRMDFLSTENVVIVCSTIRSGDGAGFPHNARRFARYIQRETIPLQRGTNFAVLGVDRSDCGSSANGSSKKASESNAHALCQCARIIDSRLAELGGNRLYRLGAIDASASIAPPVEAWRRGLFETLQKEDGVSLSNVGAEATTDEKTLLRQDAPIASSGNALPSLLIAHASPAGSTVIGMVNSLKEKVEDSTSLKVSVCHVNDLVSGSWRETCRVMLFIISNADEEALQGSTFFRLLRQHGNPLDLFSHVKYSILALRSGTSPCAGNSLGSHVVSHAQELHRHIEELGGTLFYPREEASDSEQAMRWSHGFINALQLAYQGSRFPPVASNADVGSLKYAHSGGATAPTHGSNCLPSISESMDDATETAVGVEGKKPPSDRIEATLHSWKRLTSAHVTEPVLAVNLTVPSHVHWIPGQTVSVYPTNNEATVDRVLLLMGVKGTEPFHKVDHASVSGEANGSCYPTSPLYAAIQFPATVRTVVLKYVDLRITKASNMGLFQLYEQHAQTAEEKQSIQQYVASYGTKPMQLVDFLAEFSGVQVPARHLLEHLSVMQPRAYSISSSKAHNKEILSLCFKVVDNGLCTNWMYDQCQHATNVKSVGDNELVVVQRHCVIPLKMRPATNFRMPRDPLVPLILIGPGTGVSPFMAFLQEREVLWRSRRARRAAPSALSKSAMAEAGAADAAPCGTIDLFFGCRRKADDFLFSKELQRYESNHVLNTLNVATSQEANGGGSYWYGGCYVQDKLLECGVSLCELISQRSAHIFVCGDADAMAREVHQALVDVVQTHLALSRSDASEYIEELMKSGRYVRDVWTSSSTQEVGV